MKNKKRHHTFDNAFLSICTWDKHLLIPLINEIFDTAISENAEISHLPNEQFHKHLSHNGSNIVKRITDALICAEGKYYHFECESKNDGEILLRIANYDMQISVDNSSYSNYIVDVELPNTAVIFIRNHTKLPNHGTIKYHKDNMTLIHEIPFLKVCNYSLNYLKRKKLFALFPFYLMRYEYAIKHNTKSKFAKIEIEAHRVYDILTDAYEHNVIKHKEYKDILTLCDYIVKEISQGSILNERLVKIMGTEVLMTVEEVGEFKMAFRTISNTMKSLEVSYDKACDILGITDKELYRESVMNNELPEFPYSFT